MILLLALALQCPDGSPPPCRGARAAAPVAPTSVAVLYFDNLSRDSNDAFLADGLTEELIARLGRVERLSVKSRTAVQRLRGRPLDEPAVIGRTLAVAHFVSGSVRRSGTRLRVTAELTRASTGVQVWSETFDRSSDDLMGVESEIAQAIATGVGGRLAPAERRTLAVRPTTNPEAYEHFVRGNVLLPRRTAADVRRAVGEFETAARIDPSFAGAWARAGLGYALIIDWGWRYPDLPADSAVARLSRHAAEAVSRDPASGDAWLAQALALQIRHPLASDSVVPAFERALAADSRNAELMHQFAGYLGILGRADRARQLWQRALALEPERAISLENLARLSLYRRDLDGAMALYDSALRVDPGARFIHVSMAYVAVARGDTARLRQALAESDIGPRSEVDPLRAILAAARGDTVSARRMLEALDRDEPLGPLEYFPLSGIAVAWAHAGDRQRAMEVLGRARPSLYFYESLLHPRFDILRQDSRFQSLFESMRPRISR
jgi:TolB-like protein/Tfp pilus assembly protein PilF